MTVRLLKIPFSGDSELCTSEQLKEILLSTQNFYRSVGYAEPWISYWGCHADRLVGVCSFKAKPKNDKVEIAYYTFPEFEGRGFATSMAKQLIELCYDTNPQLTITAQTAKGQGPSQRILENLGFRCLGSIRDLQDGEVLEWVHFPAPHKSAARDSSLLSGLVRHVHSFLKLD